MTFSKGHAQGSAKKEDWEQNASAYGEVMRRRATGELEEMGQVKQLMKLFSSHYNPGMSVIDVGCGAGHFLRSLKCMDSEIRYFGIDLNKNYISIAKEVFKDCPNASFKAMPVSKLGSIESKSFDCSINYMVLPFIHDYKVALREQMRITKRKVFVRLMLGDHTCIVKRYKWANQNFLYYNTYCQSEFLEFCNANGAQKVSIYEDDFVLDIPYKNAWDTYTHHGMQISGNILLEWKVAVIEL